MNIYICGVKMARLHKQIHDALNDEVLRRLKIINVNTVIEFLEQDDDKLEKIVKIEHRTLRQIKRYIIENYGGKIENGEELLRSEENNIVSTGIASLDDLLNGGLYPGEIYEICGLSSAGKTQLCHGIAINVILETDGIVRYIDTKMDFSGSRIQMMLEAKKIGDEKTARIMNRMKVTRVKNVNELFSVLYEMAKSEEKWENDMSTKLVIIDSLPSLILSSHGNTESHRSLNQIAGVLRFFANKHQISVITNNLVSKWRDIERFGAPILVKPIRVKPYLGKFWEHAPNTRLHIEKMANGEKRKISVWKSFELKIGTSCIVELTDAGFA